LLRKSVKFLKTQWTWWKIISKMAWKLGLFESPLSRDVLFPEVQFNF
jgi:hypothetical protein